MATPPPITSTAREARTLIGLAWPVVLTGLNWTILHVTDVVVVGLVGGHEVAALSASRALTFIGIVTMLGCLSGVIVFVSRADGAGDLPATGKHFREGIMLAALLGLASGGVLYAFALPGLLAVGVAPGIAPAAAAVVRTMALAYPFQLLLIAASFFLEGVSRPRRVMTVNLATLPLNAVLAWALSGGHLGLPMLGAVGAAAATVVASVAGAVLMLVAATTLPRAAERGVRDWAAYLTPATVAGAWRLLKFGTVPAIASGLELAGFSILIALSTQLGDAVTHAFQIVFSIHNVTFAVALGLGSAAGVRVGNAVGEGVPRDAPRRAAIAAGLAALATGTLALGLIVFDRAVTGAFPATAEAQMLAAAMLLVWAPFILFDGLQVVFVYALRSLGDQVAAGINGIVAFFLVTGGLGWWLVGQGLGAMALVWASGLGMVAAAALGGVRLWWVGRRL
ncbi:MATE family efflux transporter [Sphingomonas donggukensis]|uniref:MATE family efflux transporter n=1 Tax=Sphingomonas donggukensis TaxID=2949093 RepID=A0ABY4TT76_9SPHN|nr:MATE family efflux transporter [Sphingomonas donggukensis]URW75528.1 MATE family efflux transporter [Sphingomonas donggukensis]